MSAVERFKNRNNQPEVTPPVLAVGEPAPIEQTQAMVIREEQPRGLQLSTLTDFREFAEVAVAAGIVGKNENQTTAIAKAIIGIQYGAEIGLPPMQSLRSVYVINAKPALDAAAVGAMIKASGKYDYRIVAETNAECSIDFYQRESAGWINLGRSTFTIEDAKRAGLTQRNPNYSKFPKAMLRSRALTQGARSHCPEVFRGAVYSPEELANGADFDVAPMVAEQTPASINVYVDPESPAAKPPQPRAANAQATTARKAKKRNLQRKKPEAAPAEEPIDDRELVAELAEKARRTPTEKVLDAFDKFGVSQDDLVDRVGKAPDTWNEDDIAKLRALYASIDSGETRPDLEFVSAEREPGSEG